MSGNHEGRQWRTRKILVWFAFLSDPVAATAPTGDHAIFTKKIDAGRMLPSFGTMLTSIAILTLFGILLLMLETFLPGLIAGSVGTLSLLAAVWLALTAEELAAWSGAQRVSLVVGILAFSAAMMGVWLRWFAVKFFRRGFTLDAAIESSVGDIPGALRGAKGVSVTELRPLGRAEFDGRRYEVRCQTGHLAAGVPIEVISAEFGSLIVRPV